MEDERGEERALAYTAERKRSTVTTNLDRPQHRELQSERRPAVVHRSIMRRVARFVYAGAGSPAGGVPRSERANRSSN